MYLPSDRDLSSISNVVKCRKVNLKHEKPWDPMVQSFDGFEDLSSALFRSFESLLLFLYLWVPRIVGSTRRSTEVGVNGRLVWTYSLTSFWSSSWRGDLGQSSILVLSAILLSTKLRRYLLTSSIKHKGTYKSNFTETSGTSSPLFRGKNVVVFRRTWGGRDRVRNYSKYFGPIPRHCLCLRSERRKGVKEF